MEESKPISQDEELNNLNVIGKLNPAQYWEWRCSLEEITSAKHAFTIAQAKFELMAKDIEIARLRAEIYKSVVQGAKANAERIEKDYQVYRKGLEETLGFSLENCVVDEYNYTVKKI